MNLRDDEIAYLGTERCYCGHLTSLHNDHCCEFCLVAPNASNGSDHHFCTEREEREHYELEARARGNPAVGRAFRCSACREMVMRMEGGQ